MEGLDRHQKPVDIVSVFWLRKISPYVTSVLARTPITANQTTVLWGLVCVLNSYVLYRAMIGAYWLLPVVFVLFVVADLLDCVDGEIARCRNMANPIAGKLLDGICHRATEYSLLAAFVAAAQTLTASPLVLAIAVLLFSGDAMYSYVYERRVTAMRVHQGYTGPLRDEGNKVYVRGTRWVDLTRQQKVRSVAGQLHYKSIYPVAALGYVSGVALLAGLFALAAYKNWKWLRLIHRTLGSLPGQASSPAPQQPAVPVAAES